MATKPEELIGDWRRELAAAEESVAASPRLAWLSRMKVRLYRFLLACYGGGQWQTGPPHRPMPLVIDTAGADALDGKPARSGSEIRSVLAAVAKAQDGSYAPGPLAGGLDHDSWVVVAAASSKLKIGQCARLLAAAGLHPRTNFRGDDLMVEVPAHERHTAFEIVEQNRQRIHQPPRTPRTQPIPLWCRFAAVVIAIVWPTAVVAWMLVAITWRSTQGAGDPHSLHDFLLKPELIPMWGSLFLATVLYVVVRFLPKDDPATVGRNQRR